MSEEKSKPKVKEEVVALSEKIIKEMKVDENTGVGTVNKNVYIDNLPEGLTQEHVELKEKYDSTFIPASTRAYGLLSMEAMKSNEKLETTVIDVPMGPHTTLNLSMVRKDEYRTVGSEDAALKERYGNIRATVTNRAHRSSSGQLKAVRMTISEMAMEALKK